MYNHFVQGLALDVGEAPLHAPELLLILLFEARVPQPAVAVVVGVVDLVPVLVQHVEPFLVLLEDAVLHGVVVQILLLDDAGVAQEVSEAGPVGVLAQGAVVVAVHAHAGDGQQPRFQLRVHLVRVQDLQFREVAEGPGQAVSHVRLGELQLRHGGHRLLEGHVELLFQQLVRGQLLVLGLKEGLHVGDGLAPVLQLDLAGDAVDGDRGHVLREEDALGVEDLAPVRVVGAHQHGVAPHMTTQPS